MKTFLITAIAALGRALSGKTDSEAWLDHTNAKIVLALRFSLETNEANYIDIDIEEKKDDNLYLYRRDLTGKPGLFLTGRITRFDLQTLQKQLNLLKKDEKDKETRKSIDDILRRKLDWFSKGSIITDNNLLAMLGKNSRVILESIIKEMEKESKQIHSDFLKKVKNIEPEEMLVTVKLVRGSKEYHIGEFPDFVEIFKRASIRTKQSGMATCSVCNKRGDMAKFSHPALPFVTLDKPSYIPYGDPEQAFKVFPLCVDCYTDLRNGTKFVEQNLDYSVSSIQGRKGEVNFWLIPVIENPGLTMSFMRDLGKSGTRVAGKGSAQLLYLSNLRDMCSTMGVITALAAEDFDSRDSYMTFAALFYTKDKQGHMRLISRSEGIYPKRLRYVTCIKQTVDSMYPFTVVGTRFGFPLLRECLASPRAGSRSVSEGWYKDLASTLGDIFTGRPLNKQLVYQAAIRRIQDVVRKQTNLSVIMDTSFKALSLIEYVEHLDPSETEEKASMDISRESVKNDAVLQVKSFLDTHSKLLMNETLRAVCAAGIATGILLEVQKTTRKSMPFWGRLNRLDMDIERIRQLFPEILNKLHEYDFHTYDELLAYLGSQEISGLNLQQDPPKDLINLAFAVGISQGYLIVHQREK